MYENTASDKGCVNKLRQLKIVEEEEEILKKYFNIYYI